MYFISWLFYSLHRIPFAACHNISFHCISIHLMYFISLLFHSLHLIHFTALPFTRYLSLHFFSLHLILFYSFNVFHFIIISLIASHSFHCTSFHSLPFVTFPFTAPPSFQFISCICFCLRTGRLGVSQEDWLCTVLVSRISVYILVSSCIWLHLPLALLTMVAMRADDAFGRGGKSI